MCEAASNDLVFMHQCWLSLASEQTRRELYLMWIIHICLIPDPINKGIIGDQYQSDRLDTRAFVAAVYQME